MQLNESRRKTTIAFSREMIVGILANNVHSTNKNATRQKRARTIIDLSDPILFVISGCFCTFSDPNSFEYIRTSLEKTLLSNLEQEDRLPFQGLPLVIVFGPRANLTFKELETLREEGQALADR